MTILLLSLNLGAMVEVVPPSGGRLGFVPTAGDVYDDPAFVRRDRKELDELGYDVVDVSLSKSEPSAVQRQVCSLKAVFLAGGNTFYPLQELRRSGAAQLLEELVPRGFPLVGASAGAVVTGPSIEPVAAIDDPSKAPALSSFDGLNLIPFVPLPHHTEPPSPAYATLIQRFGQRTPAGTPPRRSGDPRRRRRALHRPGLASSARLSRAARLVARSSRSTPFGPRFDGRSCALGN